ncbi:MAG: Pectinesterase [Flaviaesturariibacter sp.]|nr:Pectinesterase [Flaviaesturariibacter sp.]
MNQFYASRYRATASFLTILGLLVFSCFSLQAQQPAFPGAEGAGKFTTGGRGTVSTATTVFEVTNLSDDGLAGSLRYAVTTAATYRTVVFRVSGTIHLNSKLNIKANTTLAGQTAPGAGICVADHPVVINGDNVIVRYMRFRMGDKNQKKVDGSGNPVDGSGGDDALGGTGVSNIIIDHCSVSWSDDEALTIYRGDNLSIQWCFITEPLNYSYHWETGDTDWERHGYGGIWGAKRGTMHHNLLAHCQSRNPRFAGISTYTPATVGVENVDLRNNVIYNWGINTVYGGEGGNYNVVNNYYKYGPATSSGVRYRICNPGYTVTNNVVTIPYGKWYVNGNYVDGSSANTLNNWKGVVMQGTAADTTQAKVTVPFDLGYPVTTHTAQEAYEYVLQGAGCTLPVRDTLDQRIEQNVRNRTGQIIDVQGGYPHGTPYASTVNAWPALASTTPPADDDHDGMPNAWETSNGLNPADASDRNAYAPNGYTNLENYLNSLTNPAVITAPTIFANGALASFSQTVGTPSTTQSFLISAMNLTAPMTVTPPAGYEISANGGSTWATSSSPLVLTPASGTIASTTITVRLNAATVGNYSGSISATSTGASNVLVPVSGTTSLVSQIQSIGSFPEMDGGFERQPAGATTTSSTHTSTTKWESSTAFNIDSLSARTGLKSMHWNGASTSNKYLFTPVLSSSVLQSSTTYVVQFWYRLPAPLAANIAGTSDLKLYGWSTMIGATGGTGSTISAPLTLNSGSPSGPGWTLFSTTLTTTADAPTSTYAGLRVTYPQAPYFDVDDYVVYAGSAVDNTAPDPVTAPVATGDEATSSIALSWTAPATGVDGGGYMIVRSASATVPVPNTKGVYNTGNKIGSDTILYIGTSTSYTDFAVSPGVTYYYTIYTVDKAYNYSTPVQKQGIIAADPATIITSGTVNPFSQAVGAPSASQTYTVSATNLSGNLSITPPSGFEVSANGGATWFSSTPLTLSPTGGTIASMPISVRLNAGSAGTYSGAITHASAGATTVNVVVNGTATSVTTPPAGTNVIVARDGSGNFSSIQAAIDAAPTGRTTPYIIFIKNGKYREKLTIPSNKPFIHLIGESVAGTVLSWDDYSGKPMPGGGTYGTSNSATLIINATDCFLSTLTVENTTGDAPQALAINVNADRVVLVNCRFLGGQDTVLTNGTGRNYFKNCYIDGTVDFIFGSAKAIFDSTIIYPKTRQDGLTGSYITAANTPAGQAYGYVFRDCTIPRNQGITSYVLGRPWQNDGTTVPVANNKVVFINTIMGPNIVKPEGWSTWSAGTNTSLIYYGEYLSRSFDGTPVSVAQRVPWSYQLTAAEAASYTFANVFGSWDPCTVSPSVCAGPARPVAVSNFRGNKGTPTVPSTLSWNLSWAMPGISFQLFRSSDNVSFSQISQSLSPNDSAYSFSSFDAVPPAGTTYYYYLKASKAGLATHITDTIQISSTQTIVTTGTMNPFLQGVGLPSGAQTYVVSGSNLTDNITITAPAGYEISSNGGTTWNNSAMPIVLTQTNNTIANTTISVRLNAATPGTYAGNIVHTSAGAVSVNVPVTGTVQATPLAVSVVLQHWPMTLSNADSAAIRSAGVTASTPTFKNFYSSNGTTVAVVPAYSTARGQAFGPGTTGDGTWGTPSGPGGNLSRVYYEQFTVTASSGYFVRVDSIIATSAFYNTSSNTKLAVVYSLSNFVSDSADVSAAAGPFATPIALTNQTAGPTVVYAMSVNGATGITVPAGQTLTFRLYYSCGSTTAGRYALLKDVKVKGLATVASAPPTLAATATLNPFTQTAGAPGPVQTYTLTGTTLAGNVTVTPPAGFEVSADGTTWFGNATPLSITPVSGSVNQTISVRLNAATSGSYSGSIVHASTGATSVTVAVSGTTVPAPSITMTGTLAGFAQTAGVPSAVQTYTVSGSNLSGSILITPPAGYEVSANGGLNWFTTASPLTLTPTAGAVATTTISVRLNAATSGTYSGSIAHVSSGATTVNQPVTGITVAAPQINTTGTLTSFAQTVGAPSATQTYSVSGAGLTGAITITPPAAYEVSADGGATWSTSAAPLVLAPTAGVVAATTITVRLNAATAGVYSGSITQSSPGATTVSIAVTGTTVPPPAIVVTGALAAFAQTVGTPSGVQTYTISGTNLTGALTITPPANYQVSSNGGTTWFGSTAPLVLTPTGGSIASTTISVRLNATAPGTFAGNITNTTAGTATANVAVTGTVVPAPSLTITGTVTPFAQTIGNPSAIKTYTVAGANLVGNVTLTVAAPFEISTDGVTWSTSVSLTPVSGTIAGSTISVRMNATTAGVYSGQIAHATSGAASVLLALSGTAVPPPALTVTQALTPFEHLRGTPSAVQTYTVAGANLVGNVTVTPPLRYEISLNGSTWQTTPLTLAPSAGTLAATTISIRLNGAVPGPYNGTIVHATSGTSSVLVPVTGFTRVNTPVPVTLYPVPATRTLFVAHPQMATRTALVIYSSSGQKVSVSTIEANTFETRIDVSHLVQGIYTIVIGTGSEQQTLRFIKG